MRNIPSILTKSEATAKLIDEKIPVNITNLQGIMAVSELQVQAVIYSLYRSLPNPHRVGCLSFDLSEQAQLAIEEYKKERGWRTGIYDYFTQIDCDKISPIDMSKCILNDQGIFEDFEILMVPIFMKFEDFRLRGFVFGFFEIKHFALAVFHIKENTVFYFDSCYRKPDINFFLIKKAVEKCYDTIFSLQKKQDCDNLIARQKDPYHCAIYLCVNIEQIISCKVPSKNIFYGMDGHRTRYERLMHNYVNVFNIPLDTEKEDFGIHMSRAGKVKNLELKYNSEGRLYAEFYYDSPPTATEYAQKHLSSYRQTEVEIIKVLFTTLFDTANVD
uniref:Ubiquitin-like protease family profile domain-containing protein n=1 Tax=Panagrolaimus sp. ES5 TaxID=591445 RepID=A0AC34G6X1_9BILA